MSASRESRSSMIPPATRRAHLTYWGLLAACVVTAAFAAPARNKPSEVDGAVGKTSSTAVR